MSKTSDEPWRRAMLGLESRRLRALAANYLGPLRATATSESIVEKLEAFLGEEDARVAIAALLDRTDYLILGAISLCGSTDRRILEKALSGDISRHELGFGIANLEERLLIFKNEQGGYEVNPRLVGLLDPAVVAAVLFAGPEPGQAQENLDGASGADGAERTGCLGIPTLACLAATLIREGLAAPLKTGALSSRARRRLESLAGRDSADIAAVEALVGLYRGDSGFALKRLEDDISDPAGNFAWTALIASVSGAQGSRELGRRASLLASRAASFASACFSFSRRGLDRFFTLAVPECPGEALAAAALAWGIAREVHGGMRFVSERISPDFGTEREPGRPAIAVEGTGVIHALPSASIGDILFLMNAGKLESIGGAWTFRLGRESARGAFAGGLTARSLSERLEEMAGRPLPQTLAFDLRSWEEEHDSVRLYRGYTIALDPRAAAIVEHSGLLGKYSAERLGERVYFLGSGHPAELERLLGELGLPEPTARAHPARHSAPEADAAAPPGAGAPAPGGAAKPGSDSWTALPGAPREAGSPPADPREPLMETAKNLGLDASGLALAEERIRRKLVYTPRQLRAMVQARPFTPAAESIQAGSLDFRGKLRIIQTALKSGTARLEVRRLADAQGAITLARPVALRKTESDYILEAEDVLRGIPIELKVGAIAWVRLQRSSILGEE